MSNILLTDVQILTSDTLLGSSIVPSDAPRKSILLTDIEIPVHDNLLQTEVSLNDNSPSNNDILPSYENVESIPIVLPGDGSVFPDNIDNIPQTKTLQDLLRNLSEVMIRFNTSPDYYQKDDYRTLINTISNSLIYLYNNTTTNTGSHVVGFRGVATKTTNPYLEAIRANNKYPGIYFAQDIGEYPYFGITVTMTDNFDAIVLLVPKVNSDGEVLNYEKTIYNLNTPNSNFVYSSDIARSVWIIEHNLNKKPAVVVTNRDGFLIEGQVVYTDNNNLTITFSAPIEGYADLN